jgi:hypothetical protein
MRRLYWIESDKMFKAVRECDVFVKNSTQGQVSLLMSAVWENYLFIAIAVLWVAASIALSYILMQRLKGVFSGYSANSGAVGPEEYAPYASLDAPLSPGPTAGARDEKEDGELYPEETAVREPPPSDKSVVQRRIERIKKQYAAYNKEIADYSRRVLKREPDDLYDERIISRNDD